MYKLFTFILFNLLISAYSFNVVGWYVSDGKTVNPDFPPEKLNWNIYTHIRSGGPKVFPNGTAICDKEDVVTPRIIKLSRKHQVKVQWGCGFDLNNHLWNTNNFTIKNNYINSIGQAANDCDIDGIEVDYEGPFGGGLGNIGVIIPKQSTLYTEFLAEIKTALGPGKIVSADISVWGIAPGNYLLGLLPWVNITMLNEGKIDFINTMSYHWNKNSDISSWEKDIYFLTKLWKMDPKRVNLGIPYFSMNRTTDFKIYNEPTWEGLSAKCPNIDPYLNVCDGITIVGKKMNEKLGRLIRKNKLGGVFPWAGNYDSIKYNNSLVKWLAKGLYPITDNKI